jgi:nucleotide-binding universal stress UspA family protein
MYKHILIGTEGSEIGDRAVAHGIALARTTGAQVTVVTVTQAWSAVDLALEASKNRRNPNPVLQFEEMAAEGAKRILDAAAAKAKAAGVAYKVVHVANRHAAEGIIETAEKIGADLIVMGSHGRRGINRLILGAQAYEVLSHCKVPALIVR